ncbi:MAG: hypothetical protein JW782_00625 [Candidatus Saganbacteria bacterium]|nr:hypothetical protein [Candidatus Saganbacteria bacterium]
MNIGKPFVDAWNIYIKNFGTIIIGLLIALILSLVTFGVLALPLFVGFQLLFVKAMRGEKLVANSVLDPVGRYFSLVGAYFGIGLFIFLGCILLIVPGLAFAAWWMYAMLFIVDRNMHIEDGMRSSKELVRKNGTWWHLLFLVVIFFINFVIGQIVMALNIPVWVYYVLSTVLVAPITSGALACAYADESK